MIAGIYAVGSEPDFFLGVEIEIVVETLFDV